MGRNKWFTGGLIIAATAAIITTGPYARQKPMEQKPTMEISIQEDTRFLAKKDSLFSILANNPVLDRPSPFSRSKVDNPGRFEEQKATFARIYEDFVNDIYLNLVRHRDHFDEKIPNEDEILARAQEIAEMMKPKADITSDLIKLGYAESLECVREVSEDSKNLSSYLIMLTRIGSIPHLPGPRGSGTLIQSMNSALEEHCNFMEERTGRMESLALDYAHFTRQFAMSHEHLEYARDLEGKLIDDLYIEAMYQTRDFSNITPTLPISVARHVGRTLAGEIKKDPFDMEWTLVNELEKRTRVALDENSTTSTMIRKTNPAFYNLSRESAQECLKLGKSIAEENGFVYFTLE